MQNQSLETFVPVCSLKPVGEKTNVTNGSDIVEVGFEFDEWLRSFEFVVSGGGTCFVSLLGIVLNTIIIHIFTSSRPMPLLYCYLIGLGVWDIILLIASCFMYSLPILYFGHVNITGSLYIYTYKYWYTLGNMALVGNVWIISVMTVDRYFAICHPYQHRYKRIFSSSKKTSVCYVTLTSIAAFIFGLPRFFEITVFYCADRESLKLVRVVTSTSLYIDKTYNVLYKAVGGVLFRSVGPYILILVLVFKIYTTLRNRELWWSNLREPTSPNLDRIRSSSANTVKKPFVRNASCPNYTTNANARFPDYTENAKTETMYTEIENEITRESEPLAKISPNYKSTFSIDDGLPTKTSTKRRSLLDQPDNTNVVLVFVVIKFLISHIMPTVLDITELYFGSAKFQNSTTASVGVATSNFLVVLNSASNFIIYAVLMKRFRVDLLNLWEKHIRRSSTSSSDHVTTGQDMLTMTNTCHTIMTPELVHLKRYRLDKGNKSMDNAPCTLNKPLALSKRIHWV